MSHVIRYTGKNSARGPSPSIWAGSQVAEIIDNPNKGYHLFDDFFNTPVYANGVSQAGYFPFQGTSVTIRGKTGEVGGVLRFGLPATDNIEGALITGGNIAGSVRLATGDEAKKLCFEARVRLAQLAETGVFIGLSEEGLAVTGTLAANTGALADKDFVGFHIPMHASLARASAVYREAGNAAVNVKENALTLVADTWYKFGLVYDPTTTKLTYFIDGEEVGSTLLATATNFPDGEELAMLMFTKAGEAGAKNIDLDWWELLQLA